MNDSVNPHHTISEPRTEPAVNDALTDSPPSRAPADQGKEGIRERNGKNPELTIHPTSSTSTREQDHDMDGRPAIIEGWPKVAGYCPACGTSSLFLGSGGWVTCSLDKCPNPTAASDVLDDREIEHIVELGETAFSIQHPLRERLNGFLFRCDLHDRLSACDGPPAQPGTYRVRVGERMHWEAIRHG